MASRLWEGLRALRPRSRLRFRNCASSSSSAPNPNKDSRKGTAEGAAGKDASIHTGEDEGSRGVRVRPLTYGSVRNGQACVRKAWFRRRYGDRNLRGEEKNGVSQLQIYYSRNFRRVALRQFEGKGIHMIDHELTFEDASKLTDEYIRKKEYRYIGNAKFHIPDLSLAARCDVIQNVDDPSSSNSVHPTINIILIKASKMKPPPRTVAKELAYIWYIARLSGYTIQKALAIGANPKQPLLSQNTNLCRELDLTAMAEKELEKIEKEIKDFDQKTGMDATEAPDKNPSPHCKNCALLKDCVGKNITYGLWDLPRMQSKNLKKILDNEGELDVVKISGDALTPNQRLNWLSMRTQTPLVDIEALKAMLSPSESSAPYYYLDFEHINPVIALFEGKKPFETVITQFSVHKSTVHPYHEREADININKTDNINYIENATAAGTLVRYEYLCDGTSASLEELAVQLLEALGDTGTVLFFYFISSLF